MPDSLYKVIEIIGTSPQSWDLAAKSAVERAAKTLRELRVAEVVEQDIEIRNGKLEQYRVKLKVSFQIRGRRQAVARLSRRPGVHRHYRAGDVPTAFAHQKRGHRGDVAGVGEAAQGAAGGDAFAALVAEALRQLGVDESRRDSVDRHAYAADFARQRSGEADQRGLGRRIDRERVEAGGSDDRGDD